MFPVSIIGRISMEDCPNNDALDVAQQLERRLAPAPWEAERQDNRLHFSGGVYSEAVPRWRTLFSLVGPCWLEVLPGPELTLAYKTNTGELIGLVTALAFSVGVLADAILHLGSAGIIFAAALWVGLVVWGYYNEGRRLREFLVEIVSEIAAPRQPSDT